MPPRFGIGVLGSHVKRDQGGPPSHHALKPPVESLPSRSNPELHRCVWRRVSSSKQETRLLALLSRSPPPAAQGPRLRFARSWALRSRLGAGGARRTSRIAQQSLKNQKPFSKENQRAPGLTPRSPAGNSSRTTFKACNLAQHRTRGLQSDWSASQTEKSTQNKGSRTRISGFKKRESP